MSGGSRSLVSVLDLTLEADNHHQLDYHVPKRHRLKYPLSTQRPLISNNSTNIVIITTKND